MLSTCKFHEECLRSPQGLISSVGDDPGLAWLTVSQPQTSKWLSAFWPRPSQFLSVEEKEKNNKCNLEELNAFACLLFLTLFRAKLRGKLRRFNLILTFNSNLGTFQKRRIKLLTFSMPEQNQGSIEDKSPLNRKSLSIHLTKDRFIWINKPLFKIENIY